MKRLAIVSGFGFAVLLGACAPELNLPPPPDIQERLDAFRNPTAAVSTDVMASVADGISSLYDEIDRSAFYEELLFVIDDVQDEIYNEQGEIDLGGGVTFPSPNGGVRVDFICDGWDDPPAAQPNPENGRMFLNLRLAGGSLAPLVWGTLEGCKYLHLVADQRLQALYRGGIVILFEDPLSPDEDVYEVPVIFVAVGEIVVEDIVFPIDNLFRVTFTFDENGNLVRDAVRIDILVELADATSFIFSFNTASDQQLRDGVGVLSCSLENSNCTSQEDPSRNFSW